MILLLDCVHSHKKSFKKLSQVDECVTDQGANEAKFGFTSVVLNVDLVNNLSRIDRKLSCPGDDSLAGWDSVCGRPDNLDGDLFDIMWTLTLSFTFPIVKSCA